MGELSDDPGALGTGVGVTLGDDGLSVVMGGPLGVVTCTGDLTLPL